MSPHVTAYDNAFNDFSRLGAKAKNEDLVCLAKRLDALDHHKDGKFNTDKATAALKKALQNPHFREAMESLTHNGLYANYDKIPKEDKQLPFASAWDKLFKTAANPKAVDHILSREMVVSHGMVVNLPDYPTTHHSRGKLPSQPETTSRQTPVHPQPVTTAALTWKGPLPTNDSPVQDKIKYIQFIGHQLGYCDEAIAGIIGNIKKEAGEDMNTNPKQDKQIKALGHHYKGLVQWAGSRENDLIAFAKRLGRSENDFSVQVKNIFRELEENPKYYGADKLKALANSSLSHDEKIDLATKIFCEKFERPRADFAVLPKRQAFAADAYLTMTQTPTTPIAANPGKKATAPS